MSEQSNIRSGVKSAVENLAETLKEGTAAAVGKQAHRPGGHGHESRVRDIMSTHVQCARVTESVSSVARRLADLNVGAMPICSDDDRLHGMLTDRDIVTKVVAAGFDPLTMPVGDLAQGVTVTVDVDCSVEELLHTMAEHQIRRVPVLDGTRLVGIVSQADVARALEHSSVGNLVEAVSNP